MQILLALGFPNLRTITENGVIISVRGESLSGSKNRKYLKPVKEAGIKVIIDLRAADHTDSFTTACEAAGIECLHFPVDRAYTADNEIIKRLPALFDIINRGGFYIACAQGLHRTDIALSLRYLLSPHVSEPPILHGHIKNGAFRSDDIFTRANSIFRNMSAEDKCTLGWEQLNDEILLARKKSLTKAQKDYMNTGAH